METRSGGSGRIMQGQWVSQMTQADPLLQPDPSDRLLAVQSPTPLQEDTDRLLYRLTSAAQRAILPLVSLFTRPWCDHCRLGGSVYYRCVCGRDIT